MKPNCTHSVTKAEVEVSFESEISQWCFFVVVCVMYMCPRIFWEGPSQRQVGWDGPSICDVCCGGWWLTWSAHHCFTSIAKIEASCKNTARCMAMVGANCVSASCATACKGSIASRSIKPKVLTSALWKLPAIFKHYIFMFYICNMNNETLNWKNRAESGVETLPPT